MPNCQFIPLSPACLPQLQYLLLLGIPWLLVMETFLREEGLQPHRVQTQEGDSQIVKNNRIFTEEHFQTKKLLFVGQLKSCVLEIQFENVHSRRPQIKNHWSQYFLLNPHISQFFYPDVDHFT